MDKKASFEPQFASDKDLAVRYSVSRSTIWRWAEVGLIPQPHKLSPGCSRWKLSELKDFEKGMKE